MFRLRLRSRSAVVVGTAGVSYSDGEVVGGCAVIMLAMLVVRFGREHGLFSDSIFLLFCMNGFSAV